MARDEPWAIEWHEHQRTVDAARNLRRYRRLLAESNARAHAGVGACRTLAEAWRALGIAHSRLAEAEERHKQAQAREAEAQMAER